MLKEQNVRAGESVRIQCKYRRFYIGSGKLKDPRLVDGEGENWTPEMVGFVADQSVIEKEGKVANYSMLKLW